MTTERKIAALIVAAGRGRRAGGGVPKQWRNLAGRRVIDWTIAAFATHPGIAHIQLVLHPDDMARAPAKIAVCAGRATRAGSVRAGLEALPEGITHVLIHDAARPCLSSALINRVLAALENNPGAAPGLPLTDALWAGAAGRIEATRPRVGLFRAQTPQGFALPAILAAHAQGHPEAADDVELAMATGLDVALVPGDETNLKITVAADFSRAAQHLEARMDLRLGNGFDVHRFKAGNEVTLCGVNIPHTHALEGHSDADVGMHALTDAIYGALAEGDIGQHFPPSDPQWKGAQSDIFLRHAADLARTRGFAIANADVTLICEQPKIGPHATAMRAALAEILGIELARVSVKATTSEQLGFTGRKEGIAAIATAALLQS